MDRMLKRIGQFPTQLFILIIGVCIFVSFIGNVHLLDPLETKFAEQAREMLVSGIYNQIQLHFQVVELTPPLYSWIQVLSMKLFGVNEFASRLPNAIIGILSMLLVFNIGRNYFSSAFGVFWALLLGASFLSIIYFKSGLPQPIGNYFVFLSAYFMFKVSIKDEFAPRKMLNGKMFRHVFYSAFFCSLAMITTGAINFLIVVLLVSIVLLWNRGRITFSLGNFVWWFVFQSFFIFLWLNVEDHSLGIGKLIDYIKLQLSIVAQSGTSGLRSLPLFLLVLFIGFFPSSFLIWRVLKKNNSDTIHQLLLKRWMLALLLIIFGLIYFHHDQFLHQITLAFYPLSFLGAYFLVKIYEQKLQWRLSDSLALFVGALIWTFIVGGIMYLFITERNQSIEHSIIGFFLMMTRDMKVYWNPSEIAIPLLFLVGVLVSIILFHRQKNIAAIGTLLVACILFFNLSLVSLVPKFELYTQASWVDFVKKNKGNYETANFESYIPDFYGNSEPNEQNTKLFRVEKSGYLKGTRDTTWEFKTHLKPDFNVFEKEGK